MEVFVLLSMWTRRFGTSRPVVGLSHDIGLKWPLRFGVTRIGGVRASSDAAKKALAEGFDVLVFPGGDLDALRPFTDRYRVCWGGRSGFARTAVEAGVPILPMANCGSHAQYTLLPGGPAIAKLLRFNRARIQTWPIPLGTFLLLGSVIGWAVGWWSPAWILPGLLCAFLPNPARMHIRFLPPIDAKQLVQCAGDSPRAAGEVVRRLIESELQQMASGRVTAWE
jgi:1-acyl-sn-glycerol-3-phosphate acyltransferase